MNVVYLGLSGGWGDDPRLLEAMGTGCSKGSSNRV